MNALDIYKAQYEEEKTWHPSHELSKRQWVADRVFDLTTYDGRLDELFVDSIIEVCKVILDSRTYEYIEDENNYIKYILVCQILNEFIWIDWGTSIRGAWFERDERSRDILDELEWWDDKHHAIEKVPFTEDNIKALIEFVEN